MKTPMQSLLNRWAMLGLLLMLTACTRVQPMESNAFHFDGWADGWQASAELLEYRYGDLHDKADDQNTGTVASSLVKRSVRGPMPVGDVLYVKWRIKSSGEVREERVALHDHLPRVMTDHELTFAIDGRQLHVYLVTPQLMAKQGRTSLFKTWRSRFAVTREIHPAPKRG